MKKITISVSEDLIKRARKTARSRGKTLEEAIIEWLESYARKEVSAREYDTLMKRLRRTVRTAGPYTRDEMNER
jgi:macrodomain Ter protein organizer (MatP/YcbG family)